MSELLPVTKEEMKENIRIGKLIFSGFFGSAAFISFFALIGYVSETLGNMPFWLWVWLAVVPWFIIFTGFVPIWTYKSYGRCPESGKIVGIKQVKEARRQQALKCKHCCLKHLNN